MATRHITSGSPFQYILLAALVVVLAGCTGGPTTGRTSGSTPVPGPTDVGISTPFSPGPASANGGRGDAGLAPTPAATAVLSPGKPLQGLPTPIPTPLGAIPPGSPFAKRSGGDFAEAPDRDLYQLAAELSRVGPLPIPRVVNADPVSYTEGHRDTFWLVDLIDLAVYRRQFDLRLVSPRAYWYVEEGQTIRQSDIERAAAIFEKDIYPRVTAVFGQEWSPGVDNDPHLNIIHARLRGVGGYYSSTDEYPRSVYRYSNQREMIYINTASYQVGSTAYLAVLAHELQHAIHWHGDPTEDTWVNEGLSELAVTVAGYRPDSIAQYLRSPTVSLLHWPLDQRNTSAHYGAASLFMHYLSEHYGTRADLRLLVAEPADNAGGIDAYLKTLGYNVTFRDVFRDWVVANILNEAGGVYGYKELRGQTKVQNFIDRLSEAKEVKSTIPQYAVEYTELTSFNGPLRLRFQGAAENALIPLEVGGQGCWWSNSGDSINSTLTRSIDLTGLKQATLSYQVWYQLEKDWDYAYVEISVDGGRTWDILETPHTSRENPIGNGFGPGYTGDSSGWTSETVDLTPYAGRPVLLRFQYVTDDAVNGAGLCFRQIAVPEAGVVEIEQGWRANGFVLTNNRVRQEYIVQVIQVGQDNRVTVIPLDSANSGELVIPNPQELNRLVVAVAALAPKTLQPAPYTLTVEPAS